MPNFAIRGLHVSNIKPHCELNWNYTIPSNHEQFPFLQYDIEKGLLLKLDSFLQIQLGTVFRGITPVPDDEVLKLYGNNRFIPIRQVEGERGSVSKEFT